MRREVKPLSSHTHENPLGFYIRNIAHTLRYRIEEELSHYSISSAQGRLLGIMAHSSDFPGCTEPRASLATAAGFPCGNSLLFLGPVGTEGPHR